MSSKISKNASIFLQRVASELAEDLKGSVILPPEGGEKETLHIIRGALTPELVEKAMKKVLDRDVELAVMFKHKKGLRNAFCARIYYDIKNSLN